MRTENQAEPRIHCIIPDAQQQHLLLVEGAAGLEVPTVPRTRPGWFATEVGQINQAVAVQFGLDATVLRDLGQDGGGAWCELEMHGGHQTRGCWVSIGDLADLVLAHGERSILDAWSQALAEPPPAARPPWECRGWHTQAVAWIHEQLADLGIECNGPIRQYKAAWSWSCLLTVPTDSGELFFKAAFNKPPGEVALILSLQPRWAQCLPRLLAADERGWMLMENFAGEPIEGLPSARWGKAAARFAELQQDCASDIDEWLALGCKDHRLALLPRLFAEVLADEQVLFARPDPLSSADVDILQKMMPLIEQLCTRLATFAIPETLHQLDFRSGNLIAIGEETLFYDWGDTVVSHPFLSVQRMLDFARKPDGVLSWDWEMAQPDDGLRRTIRDAYLAVWASLEAPHRLHEAFVLSRKLNLVYQVVRWYQEIAHVEVTSQWGRVMPRETRSSLRHLLAARESL